MVEEIRVMIIKRMKEQLEYMGTSSTDSRLVYAEIVNNLSVAFRNLQEKE